MKASILLFTAVMAAAIPATYASPCTPPARVQTLKNTPTRTHALYEWASTSVLTETPAAHELPQAIQSFQSWVKAQTPTDQLTLLRRQEKIYKVPAPNPHSVFAERLHDFIQPISCLESQLLNRHLEKFPNQKFMAEFEAYLFITRDDRLQVIFASAAEPGKPGMGPSGFEDSRKFLTESRERHLNEGSRLFAHLHSHPFAFNNPYGDIAGTVIPSGCSAHSDMRLYLTQQRESGMQQAWLTNGFDTVRMPIDSQYFRDLLRIKDQQPGCRR